MKKLLLLLPLAFSSCQNFEPEVDYKKVIYKKETEHQDQYFRPENYCGYNLINF